MAEVSPVEQVRTAVDVVQLISRHVNLKKSGRTYKALCPFHTEKTPSFVVFPETGRWHCFGCGEGGDAFSFLMKIEHLTFPEALRRLAESVGVPLPQARSRPEDREAYARLHSALDAAAVYYHGLLLASTAARGYLIDRGITEDTTRRFLLGLAPEADQALRRQLLSNGFTLQELVAAGLVYDAEDGPQRDRFRGRLMFPIHDQHGRIVSFGGRTLSPDVQPKYLNGPQTEIFDKGATLYGLHAATEAIRRERRGVVVEGYVDVVVAHQGGFENVVATLGTAITDWHLRQLARLAPEICLALDADQAGQSAALRGAEVAGEAVPGVRIQSWRTLLGFERTAITIAVLPEGKDPDELILADPGAWRSAIAAARPVVEQAIQWVLERHDVATLAGKREASETLIPLLAEIADPIARFHYLELAAQGLRIDPRALAERLRGRRRPAGRQVRANAGAEEVPSTPDGTIVESYAMALTADAARRGLPPVEFDPEDFSSAALRGLLLRLQELLGSELRGDWRPDPLEAAKEPWLASTIDQVQAILSELSRLTDPEIVSEARAVALELREARLAREMAELRSMLTDPELDDADTVKNLIARTARARAQLATHSEQRTEGRQPPAIPWRFRVSAERPGV